MPEHMEFYNRKDPVEDAIADKREEDELRDAAPLESFGIIAHLAGQPPAVLMRVPGIDLAGLPDEIKQPDVDVDIRWALLTAADDGRFTRATGILELSWLDGSVTRKVQFDLFEGVGQLPDAVLMTATKQNPYGFIAVTDAPTGTLPNNVTWLDCPPPDDVFLAIREISRVCRDHGGSIAQLRQGAPAG